MPQAPRAAACRRNPSFVRPAPGPSVPGWLPQGAGRPAPSHCSARIRPGRSALDRQGRQVLVHDAIGPVAVPDANQAVGSEADRVRQMAKRHAGMIQHGLSLRVRRQRRRVAGVKVDLLIQKRAVPGRRQVSLKPSRKNRSRSEGNRCSPSASSFTPFPVNAYDFAPVPASVTIITTSSVSRARRGSR